MFFEAFLEAAIDAMEARRRQAAADFSRMISRQTLPRLGMRSSVSGSRGTGDGKASPPAGRDWWKEAKRLGKAEHRAIPIR